MVILDKCYLFKTSELLDFLKLNENITFDAILYIYGMRCTHIIGYEYEDLYSHEGIDSVPEYVKYDDFLEYYPDKLGSIWHIYTEDYDQNLNSFKGYNGI